MNSPAFRSLTTVASLFFGVFVALPFAGCDGQTELVGNASCIVGSVEHASGSSFLAPDGCNTCTCDDGAVGCTAMACLATCSYNGQTYVEGDSFPAGDGCNTCSCEADGAVACTLMECEEGCSANGQLYNLGDTYSPDGCNTCTCDVGGVFACTEMACPSCFYAGQGYFVGDSFPALDGCNTCTCLADGSVSCTKIACLCDPEVEWWRDYVATDPSTCAVIDFGCPPNTTGFENACGCGCEQDTSCPEWFDCMPPAMCDLEQIALECPYSGVAF